MTTTLTAKQLLLLRSSAATPASRQLIDRIAQQVTPQAIAEATTGDQDAADRLDTLRPTWRTQGVPERLYQMLTQGRHRKRTNVL